VTSTDDGPQTPQPGATVGPPAVAGGERTLDERVRMVWTAESGLATGIGTLVVFGIEVALRLAGSGWPVGILTVPVALAGGLMAWRLPAASWRSWRFELAPEALELRHGFVITTRSAIPYHRVQYIDLKSGPFDRIYGLAHLVIHTAAASSDKEIPGLDAGEAETLRRALLERAGIGDAV